jgi:hypothetical protein
MAKKLKIPIFLPVLPLFAFFGSIAIIGALCQIIFSIIPPMSRVNPGEHLRKALFLIT